MEATLVGLLVSAFVPKILELLKSQRWAPFIAHLSPRLNRLTAIAIATLTTLGVTVDFDAATGVLTVGGLLPHQILSFGLSWLLNFAVQEAVYRKFINQDPDRFVGIRGFRVWPIVLALGLSAAACSTHARGVAVKADATIYSVLVTVQDAADQLTTQGVITIETRRELSPHLLKALKLGRAFNESLQASTPFEMVKPLLDALGELRGVIERLLPAGAQAVLVPSLERALALVPQGAR